MSLPWPLLLLAVSERSSDAWVLGLAAAARMLPYVAVSWCAGRIGDRVRRDGLMRLTMAGRVVLLAGAGLALAADHVLAAVVLATLAVAVATPAYPALAAGMPGLAGPRADRVTGLLVTVEVASFVVGPAIGGLLLLPALRPATVPVAVALIVAAWALMAGVRIPAPRRPASGEVRRESLRHNRPAMRAVGTAALVNVVLGGAGVALVGLAADVWGSPDVGYGLTTAALGFGAVAGPLVGLAVVAVCRPQWSRAAVGLVLMAVPVAMVALAPGWGWAMAPLAVVGAAATYVEAEATGDIQRSVPDHARAGVLGVTDTAMVAAMTLGSFAAPAVADLVGHRWLVVLLAVVCCAGLVGSRPSRPGAGLPRQRTGQDDLVIDLREAQDRSNASTRRRVASSQGLTASGRT
jgi:MFS family permease